MDASGDSLGRRARPRNSSRVATRSWTSVYLVEWNLFRFLECGSLVPLSLLWTLFLYYRRRILFLISSTIQTNPKRYQATAFQRQSKSGGGTPRNMIGTKARQHWILLVLYGAVALPAMAQPVPRRDDPAADGWDTEVFSAAVESQLKRVGALLLDPAKIGPGTLAALATDKVICTPLRDDDATRVFDDGMIVADRNDGNAGPRAARRTRLGAGRGGRRRRGLSSRLRRCRDGSDRDGSRRAPGLERPARGST